MIDRSSIMEGMVVRSADGDKLGKVVRADESGVQIEKGIFFPREYVASYEQLDQIQDGDLYLKWGTYLVEQQYDSLYGAGTYQKDTSDEGLWTDYSRPGGFNNQTLNINENVENVENVDRGQTIPLREEELRAERRGMQEVGRVRIHKTVSTQEQRFTVPVRREEVRVERVSASDASLAASSANVAGEFREETVEIPIREEQVEVTKRPVVREAIKVEKRTEEVGREVSGTVRREEARIDKEGEVESEERVKRDDLGRKAG